MVVRLAVPAAAPPAKAHSRKLRRDSFVAIAHSPQLDQIIAATAQGIDARSPAAI
jgi:hypothetical protein